ncbi:bifunctional diaminohydroxyphosphoribosylaminopyrimidine deaminase/5-amino-6-(5-phosphoribosylamino)uracil reductase RibD [Salibacterium halotolerans]|uniref:Riboflavin biosynthesis protein RibD n=1 Tax=Salibacterium halotolerans TaxID=1884432 RepID=A0A1I5NVU9_9BACI|nr:bifunctional diaminohydroxyphosphoribosylaminopyrimidine deaminase/5-amino-6-(5-phosphoribosylamino)uracil reductase RibD [Salibacterium halotolerans]SFP25426.1 diaminohydroxyphosphoribosylaminopyrimidine deaminase / 5-amino-6-(5-phosphoribosylamino)uracil reductase [Salibacterium halotolerans]
MTDEEYMDLALHLAESTKGQTSPNPSVGAVVVNNGMIAGMGAHLKAGEEHAEVHALQEAKEKAEGGTMYVTLEPCSHTGKTPPCVEAIINSGIRRVIIATLDPNPEVSGSGVEKLRQAGIEVSIGAGKDRADWLNRYFMHFMKTGMPYVTLKTAVSLDGKTATATGESQWITGGESRKDSHRLRHKHDAILAGIGTVLHDDPSLTARAENGGSQPVRVVLDHHLRIPLEASMLQDEMAPVWIFCGSDASEEKKRMLEQTDAVIYQVEEAEVHLEEVLTILGNKSILSVFVEGGSEIHGRFVEEKRFQEFVSYTAPVLIGGRFAPTAAGGEGITRLNEAPRLEVRSVEQLGSDIKVTAVRKGE